MNEEEVLKLAEEEAYQPRWRYQWRDLQKEAKINTNVNEEKESQKPKPLGDIM